MLYFAVGESWIFQLKMNTIEIKSRACGQEVIAAALDKDFPFPLQSSSPQPACIKRR